jgi:cytochrome o ubiquinol oxidase operon protein cyoD
VQLRFFLHLGQEAKPRWETMIFYFMVLVLLIIALGSLWIMHDLEERVMSNMEMTHD